LKHSFENTEALDPGQADGYALVELDESRQGFPVPVVPRFLLRLIFC